MVGGPACRCAEVGPRARTPAQSSRICPGQSRFATSALQHTKTTRALLVRAAKTLTDRPAGRRDSRGIADPLGWARDKHSDRLQNLSESDALLSFRCAGFSAVPPHLSDRLDFQPRYSSASAMPSATLRVVGAALLAAVLGPRLVTAYEEVRGEAPMEPGGVVLTSLRCRLTT